MELKKRRKTMSQNNELKHYGVMGMKWGIRRYQPYPKGGQGKFVGKDGRLATKEELKKSYRKASASASTASAKSKDKSQYKQNLVDLKSDKKMVKKDNKFIAEYGQRIVTKDYNKSVRSWNNEGIKKFNEGWSNKNLDDPKTFNKYLNSYRQEFTKHLNNTTKANTSSTGNLTTKWVWREGSSVPVNVTVETDKGRKTYRNYAKHSSDPEETDKLTFSIIWNDDKTIRNLVPVNDIKHSDTVTEDQILIGKAIAEEMLGGNI